MKNLLALIGLVVVVAVGAGWYLGWYKIGTEPGSPGTIDVDVNTNKIKQDLKKGRDAFGNLVDQKSVEAQPVSRSIDPNISITLPSLPALPEVPKNVQIEFNKDGTLKPTVEIVRPREFQGK
jgi:hypothetical protein